MLQGNVETPVNGQGEREAKRPQSKPTQRRKIDRHRNYEALEALVTAFGAREAARQTGMNPSTVKVLAWRRGWHHANPPKEKPGRRWKPKPETLVTSSQIPNGSPLKLAPVTERGITQPISNLSAGKALEAALTRLKAESSFNLATYSAKASKAALQSDKPLEISRKVKDVADIHKTVWPHEAENKQILNIGFIINGC